MPSAPYQQHHGLTAPPFAVAPNPHVMYLGRTHREALAHLLYGLRADGGGIVLLTGAAGTGKTLLCRAAQAAATPEVHLACIDTPAADSLPLLAAVCAAFGVASTSPGSVNQHVEALNALLLTNQLRGRRSVLLIDEAQRLSADTLEQLRLLTNLQVGEQRLLQILLVGRPELHALLQHHALRQLAQRIVARCQLLPLGSDEVAGYVQHRLAAAGGPAGLWAAAATAPLHAATGGLPRDINLLCDRALLDASVRGERQLGAGHIQRAARELGLHAAPAAAWRPRAAVAATLLLTIGAATAMLTGGGHPEPAMAANAPALPALPVQTLPDTPPVQALADFAWPEPLTGADSAAAAQAAQAALLQRWGAEPPAGSCGRSPAPELRCLRMRAGLAELAALNLPAVLHLADAQGRRLDVLLTGLDGTDLVVQFGGEPRRLRAATLPAIWQGEHTLAWRAPADADALLSPGSRGAAVPWLRERLSQWRGGAPGPLAAAPFDATLQHQVREFQAAEGLEPDGLVGLKTLTRLAARTDPLAPRLRVIPEASFLGGGAPPGH